MKSHIQRNTPAFVRWGLTLLWTGGQVLLMLSPSGDGTPISWISRLFGGTDFSDAVGHVLIFAMLALLWQWALRTHVAPQPARHTALLIAVLLGTATELGQHFVPNRGANLWDLAANLSGAAIAALALAANRRYSS